MKNKSQASELFEKSRDSLKWLIFLFGILLYANTLNHHFALDDYSVIMEHDYVQMGVDGIDEILTTNYRHGQQGFNDGLYRPMSLITFAIEKSLFNMNPSIAHGINVLIYALGLLFLLLALKNIFQHYEIVIPLLICLLFAAHPLHTEVVANIKSRDELLAFFGFTLSLYAFLKAEEKKGYYILGIFAFLMALFSKESAVLYAFVIPLMIYFKKGKKLKDLKMILLITLPLAIAFMLLRNHIVHSMENPIDPGNFGLLNNPIAATEDQSLRWGSALALQPFFIAKLFFPIELIHDYSYNQIPLSSLSSPLSILGILIYLGCGVMAVWGLLKKQVWGLIALLYLFSIVIAAQLLIEIGVHFAERLLFLAVLPFSIFVVLGFRRILRSSRKKMSVGGQKSLFFLVMIPIGIFSLESIDRNLDWKNNFSLYSADIEKGAASARVNYNYGSSLSEMADQTANPQEKQRYLQFASKHLKKATEIYPDYLDAWNNLGVVYKKLGNYEGAIAVYQANIKREPNYAKNYYNLATAYYSKGDYRNALIAFNDYIERVPTDGNAYLLMARTAGNMQRFSLAISHLNASLQYIADNPDAYNMLGMAYGSLDQYQEAEKALLKAIELNSRESQYYMNLAVNYHRKGDTLAEIRILKRLLEMDPNHQAAQQQLNSLQK